MFCCSLLSLLFLCVSSAGLVVNQSRSEKCKTPSQSLLTPALAAATIRDSGAASAGLKPAIQ